MYKYKMDLSNGIRIKSPKQANKPNIYLIQSKDSIFNHELVLRYDEYTNTLVIRRVGIDYVGKTSKPMKHIGYWQTSISESNLKEGDYLFDEDDSTEDCKIIYF